MFLITNRAVDEHRDDHKALGGKLNPERPRELRLAEATREGKSWKVKVLPDKPSDAMLAEMGLSQSDSNPIWTSRYVAYKLAERIQRKQANGKRRDLLLFVHGFNNDLKAVLDRAERIESTYGVEVVPFTWPANGGGLKGVASYKSDKRDALASVGALDRVIARAAEYLDDLNQERNRALEAAAEAAHPDDAEKWDAFYTRAANKQCPFTVNLMLHSMGNYIYKHMLGSSVYRGHLTVFDNVVLVAADTNNEDHARWVDRIQCRGRIYITLNENDSALAASRMKMGEQQKARLGHYPHRLDSTRAIYVDFTQARSVGKSHAYFEGAPARNPRVKGFFAKAFRGEAAELDLDYNIARKLYIVD